MKLMIDNQDGAGALDYTSSLSASASLCLKRSLNAPSICTFGLLLDAAGLPIPVRYAMIIVSDDQDLVLFTGYVVSPSKSVPMGVASRGTQSQVIITAISDEVLLDSTLSVARYGALNQSAAQTLSLVGKLSSSGTATISASSTSATLGRFEANAGASWSTTVQALASSARSAYRVVGGVAQMTAAGAVTHNLSELDGTLQLSGLQASAVKLLANDVILCGAIEAAAYVTETFQGDGVTSKFTLSDAPYEAPAQAKLTLTDLFQQATLNPSLWQWVDSSSRLSITSNGLTCTGGSGRDSETYVSALQQVELGGTVVAEAGGVQFQAASAGVILGLYFGAIAARNCMAGFSAAVTGGVTQLSALVNGSLAGLTFQPLANHLYTLRTRLFCPEMERIGQSYYYLGAAGVGSQGGAFVAGGGRLVLEVQDVTNGVPGAPVTLYDGSLSSFPAACTLGALDSGNLNCSLKTIRCKQTAPLWASLMPSGGSPSTLHIGPNTAGGSCSVNSSGVVTFYPDSIPPVGSQITIFYRSKNRAVSRRATGQAMQSPAPATQMWMGTVREPAAWSSVDCDNAALALLQSSSVASAAWEGTYTAFNVDESWDVWPGDVLSIDAPSSEMTAEVVVREATIDLGTSVPQLSRYTIRFANDWAEELALKLSSAVPEDAWLPQQALTAMPLQNLNALLITAITSSQIEVTTNVTAPAGGGFEVKRQDWTFGPGADSDLVLRSPVSTFVIPRVAPVEQYFIRMYDGANPPNYSRFSAAIFVNVPL